MTGWTKSSTTAGREPGPGTDMDWRRFYREDAESARGREAVRTALAFWADGDPAVLGALRAGGIASFPHTFLADSAEPLARVAATIVAGGFQRVLALGVLHGGTLPKFARAHADVLQRGGPGADRAFEALGGAFVGAQAETTALGPRVRHEPGLLGNEFSLDLFDVVLATAAHAQGREPPEVVRVFVGPTRSPDGDFAVASEIVAALRPHIGTGTACVATGDLVHFGHGYAPPADVAALPADLPALEHHFESRVRAMLDLAFREGDIPAAYGMSSLELRSDQRNLLPVISHLVGPFAHPDVLSFRLSDYGPVLGHPPPCVVASALVTIRPAAS